MTVHFLQNRRL